MPTITVKEARTAAKQQGAPTAHIASDMLTESVLAQSEEGHYDIFLAHAAVDERIVFGVFRILQTIGYSVYIDWLEDPLLNRDNVTRETAECLRNRMNICSSLFYVLTPGASHSIWMPWECGYFDGRKGRCAILPVTEEPSDSFAGQEYLHLYPYVTKGPRKADKQQRLWVRRSGTIYVEFEMWLNGKEPRRH